MARQLNPYAVPFSRYDASESDLYDESYSPLESENTSQPVPGESLFLNVKRTLNLYLVSHYLLDTKHNCRFVDALKAAQRVSQQSVSDIKTVRSSHTFIFESPIFSS
jgi:hypothetical protein